MAVLPDLTAAALYAIVVFLLVLGIFVVFFETVSNRALAAAIVGGTVIAIAFASAGEIGLAVVVVGVAGALIANHAFEWLTAR